MDNFEISLPVLLPNTNTGHVISYTKIWPINSRDITDITRLREDMNFMFEWQEQYNCSLFLYSVLFFLSYRRTDDSVFDDFLKISEDFSKLF